MNTESIDVTLCKNGTEALRRGPGAIVWDENEEHLFVIMPGHKYLDAIAVTRDPAKTAERIWLLTGTREKPTLHPSLLSRGLWHGFLRNGRFVSC